MREAHWNWLPFPSPGNLPDLGIESHLLHWQADFFFLPLHHLGSHDKVRIVRFEVLVVPQRIIKVKIIKIIGIIIR